MENSLSNVIFCWFFATTAHQLIIFMFLVKKIVAAFRGMHVSLAKHSSCSVTDGQTDDGQIDPYVSLCFAGDTTKISLKFCESFRCFLAVFIEKIQKNHYLNYVRRRIGIRRKTV